MSKDSRVGSRSMVTIAIANQKGGVGKTTVARNLAFHAIEKGLRTLCVDLDPQKNFSKTMRAFRLANLNDQGTDEVLCSSDLFHEPTDGHRLPLSCGRGASLIAAERELVDVAALPLSALHYPAAFLRRLAPSYDICIIDTAPTLGNPLYAALIAADYVVCPCTVDQDATDGLGDLFEDITRVRQIGWNRQLSLLGVLANCVNSRRRFDLSGLETLRAALGELVLNSVLYERAAAKYYKDRAVWQSPRGESHQLAAKEMQQVCNEIFSKTGLGAGA